MLTILLLFLIVIGIYWYQNEMFKKTIYYKMTHHSFRSTVHDLGRYGEYLTYKHLKSYEDKGGKFLFNCYLPKDDGTTTEIDVMLINEDGIFCFESKNYSGWIFGNEKSKTWTQSLPQGKGRSHKEYFLNPIIQNKVHIKWLKKQIGDHIPVHSIIVFSKRCTLKKVTIESPNIYVINRPMIGPTVRRIGSGQSEKLTPETINKLYNSLYPYTQVSDTIKDQHIEDIRNKSMDKPYRETNNTNSTVEIQEESLEEAAQQGEGSINDSSFCPKCGAGLVLRTAKRGGSVGKQFYGCSSYPKCRFIKNL